MKKTAALLLFVLMAVGFAKAQTQTFENVLKMDLRNKGYIMENDNLVGTYLFYLNEKVDRKTDSYLLKILDNNLSLVKSIEIERPRKSYLLEMVFNGKAFMMMFFTAKGNLDLVTYDKNGTKLGEKNFEDLTRMEKYTYQMSQTNGTNATIYPTGDGGFVRQAYAKNEKDGYRIEAYDNNLNQIWTAGSDEKSEMVEGGDIIYSSTQYTGLNVLRKKKRTSREYDLFFQLIDSKTGKLVFEKPLKDNGADLSMLTCFIDESSKQVIIGGEYFAPGEDQGKAKSQGMFMMTFDFTGTQKQL